MTLYLGGTVDGFFSASFIAPFVISIAMFVGFFLWEARIDQEKALLPVELMKLPNLMLLCFMA
jgi:hypothetical protein